METNKSIIIGIVLVLALAAIYFLIYGNPYSNNYSNRSTNNNSTAQSNTGANTVSILNFAFNPSTLTVSKGTTVTWTNEDSAEHEIKSDTFGSSLLSKGATFSHTFDQTGTFNYSCAIHTTMQGKIIVQ